MTSHASAGRVFVLAPCKGCKGAGQLSGDLVDLNDGVGRVHFAQQVSHRVTRRRRVLEVC